MGISIRNKILKTIISAASTNCWFRSRAVSATKAYEMGSTLVKQKVKTSLQMYNEMMNVFSDYENVCLYDTVAKELDNETVDIARQTASATGAFEKLSNLLLRVVEADGRGHIDVYGKVRLKFLKRLNPFSPFFQSSQIAVFERTNRRIVFHLHQQTRNRSRAAQSIDDTSALR